MNAKEITKALKRSGMPVKVLSEKLGVKPPTVSQVIHRVRPNPRIRQAIAEAIRKPVDEIWPSEKQTAV